MGRWLTSGPALDGGSWRILGCLLKREATAANVAAELQFQVPAARERLEKMVDVGLVFIRNPAETSSGSEPVYDVRDEARSLSFPMRNYLFLSESLVSGLVDAVGKDAALVLLEDIGVRTGEAIGDQYLMKGDFRGDPSSFAKSFVGEFLGAMGASPQLVRSGPWFVEYEQQNCPFQELARKFPAVICDVLDEAIHKGMDRKLGVKSARLSCIGHGATSCRFRTVFGAESK